jgi:hypothetical protein
MTIPLSPTRGNPGRTDSSRLYKMLIDARMAGDRVMEAFARDRLAVLGLRIGFADVIVAPSGERWPQAKNYPSQSQLGDSEE